MALGVPRRLGGRLFEDRVDVDAAEAERIDAGAAHAVEPADPRRRPVLT